MFVPRSPGGNLLTALRKAEVDLQTLCPSKYKWVELVEEGGLKLKEILCKKDP